MTQSQKPRLGVRSKKILHKSYCQLASIPEHNGLAASVNLETRDHVVVAGQYHLQEYLVTDSVLGQMVQLISLFLLSSYSPVRKIRWPAAVAT